MRIATVLFAGSVAALAAMAAPVLAKNSDAQKTDEKQTATSCNSYQQGPDGSWSKLPCAEVGSPGQTQHRSATTQSSGDEAR